MAHSTRRLSLRHSSRTGESQAHSLQPATLKPVSGLVHRHVDDVGSSAAACGSELCQATTVATATDIPHRATDGNRSLRETAPATLGEDAITLALSVWLIGGLFLDGYAHTYVIDTETEDFFTPWHGVFYAGFAAVAAWVAWIGYRRRQPGRLIDWFPASYRHAVVGIALFAAGGVGDAIWHTIFGIEVGIDALLSPTHVVLLIGGLLILWTPVRSVAERVTSATETTTGDAWLRVGAVTLVTALLAFFVQYLWVLPYTWFAAQAYDPRSGAGVFIVEQFFGGALVTTAILLGPVLLAHRHAALRFGSVTAIWTATQALETLAFSKSWNTIILAFGAGVVFDLVYRIARSEKMLLACAAGPAALWTGFVLAAAWIEDLTWPPELIGGLIMITALSGAGASLLTRE